MVEPFHFSRYQRGTLPPSSEEREARRLAHSTFEVPKCAG